MMAYRTQLGCQIRHSRPTKKTQEYPPLVINTIEFALSFCVLARSRSSGIDEEHLETLKDKMNENWTTVKNILDSMPEEA